MEELSLKKVLGLYKQKLRFIICFVCIFTGIVAVYSFIMPVEYTSQASLFPPRQAESGNGLSSFLKNFSGGGGALSIGMVPQTNQGQVYAEIINSRGVAEYIIDKCNFKKRKQYSKLKHEKLILLVQKSIDVTIDKSGVIYLSAIVKSPFFTFGKEKLKYSKLSQDMANSAIAALDSIVKVRSIVAAKVSLEYSEKATSEYRTKLDSIEIKLRKFQSENKVLEIEEQTKSLLTQQVTLGSELMLAEGELEAALEEYSPSSVIVKQLQSKVDFLRKQYDKAQSGGMFKNDNFSIPFSDIPELMREYTALYRDKKIYEQVLLYLETQSHQDALQASRDISQVELLDFPNLPEIPTAPHKTLMVVLAFMVSTIIALLFIVIKYQWTNKNNI
ncbi:MAG: hypothetical protein IKH10_03975 [Bacteroidetes bacterium]|nr:hypothetical protein [Bacteroidota bacterium]